MIMVRLAVLPAVERMMDDIPGHGAVLELNRHGRRPARTTVTVGDMRDQVRDRDRVNRRHVSPPGGRICMK